MTDRVSDSFFHGHNIFPGSGSPYYNESHYKIRRQLRAWIDKELMPNCHQWSENKEIPKWVLTECAKRGILAAVCGHVPEDYLPYGLPGGIKYKDWDPFHEMIVLDELARCGSAGLLWGIQGVCRENCGH